MGFQTGMRGKRSLSQVWPQQSTCPVPMLSIWLHSSSPSATSTCMHIYVGSLYLTTFSMHNLSSFSLYKHSHYISIITCMGFYRLKIQKTDSDTKICAHLGFSVLVCYRRLIDMKMHSHESLGQRNHNDTTCT
jgi:hypothetical protein